MLKCTYKPTLSTRVPGFFHIIQRPVSSMHERQHATQTTKRTSELLHKRICAARPRASHPTTRPTHDLSRGCRRASREPPRRWHDCAIRRQGRSPISGFSHRIAWLHDIHVIYIPLSWTHQDSSCQVGQHLVLTASGVHFDD